jgi:acetyl esterase
MLLRLLSVCLVALSALTGAILAECEIPADKKIPHKTFVINDKVSCATNQFMYLFPVIAAGAEAKVSADEKAKSSQAVGRVAYELLSDAFAANKPDIPVKDFTIQGNENNHEIPVRLYTGKDDKKIILFIHGGGWSRGNLKTHDTLCRNLCDTTGATVLAVDYRLAPENPYPAGLDDATSAYNWVIENHKDAKILIAGDSGGGNITTSLTLKLIKEDKRIPDGVILIYPALDLRIPEKTENPYANGYFLTRDSINAYVHNYLGDDYEKAKDPLVSPLLASDDDLKKFPPVAIVNAECDPLAEEGGKFADRLKGLGVDVNRKVVPQTIHVFTQYPDIFVDETKEAYDFIKKQAFKESK